MLVRAALIQKQTKCPQRWKIVSKQFCFPSNSLLYMNTLTKPQLDSTNSFILLLNMCVYSRVGFLWKNVQNVYTVSKLRLRLHICVHVRLIIKKNLKGKVKENLKRIYSVLYSPSPCCKWLRSPEFLHLCSVRTSTVSNHDS